MSDVMDQKDCNGCWAYSTCLALSDRIRMRNANNGLAVPLFTYTTDPDDGSPILNSLSPQYMIRNNLCKIKNVHTNDKMCHMGCNGGYIDSGIKYLMVHGSITIHDDNVGNESARFYTARDTYKIPPDPASIASEIVANGPVVAGFDMYENCYNEEFDRFYNTAKGKLLFKHAMCIVGWTTNRQDGRKYWICRNSYGKNYMDNGYFYILMGSNFCNIESYCWGITPAPLVQ